MEAECHGGRTLQNMSVAERAGGEGSRISTRENSSKPLLRLHFLPSFPFLPTSSSLAGHLDAFKATLSRIITLVPFRQKQPIFSPPTNLIAFSNVCRFRLILNAPRICSYMRLIAWSYKMFLITRIPFSSIHLMIIFSGFE